MANKNRCLTPATDDECRRARLSLQDTLDVVGGKWKLVLNAVLQCRLTQLTERLYK